MCVIYRGGKKRVAEQIIEALPQGEMFIDVFGGSGCVSGAAVRSRKYTEVIYNDLDAQLVGFLKIVRDRLDDLIEYLNATPMGRHLSEEVCELFKSDNPIERAAAVFYCCNFQGQPVATRYPSWLKPRIVSRGNIAHGVGRLENRMNKLRGVVSVLRQIYFENRPASKILELYSKTQDYMYREGDINLVFFLDPPYGTTQDYPEKFNDTEMLIEFFLQTEWTVALCGESGQFPELESYEFFPFVDKGGKPTDTWVRSEERGKSYEQGMYVKIREGETDHRKRQLSLL